MKKNESIDEMFERFQTILNGLKSLQTKFSKDQNNLKILDSLPKIWEPKVIIISKVCDLKVFTLDELIGALRVHEVHLNNRDHLKANDTIALKGGDTIKRREKGRPRNFHKRKERFRKPS
uniref:Retrovirus-related Pol polyprotein from transposon TNT 1-94 n=1 Tax=Cajanus cajan TaxID=3821 RepID=A0A151QTR7_CAJCA|nr:hypothetical protein KK1_045411 [Cajanus cajan]